METDDSSTLYIGILIVGGIIMGLIGLWLTNFIEIVSTSFFGSYMVFRVLGLVLGGYPDYKQL